MAAFPGTTQLTFLLSMANFNQRFTVLTSNKEEDEEEERKRWKVQLRTLCVINCDPEDLILERAFYESLCFLPALRNLTLYDVYLGPKQELAVLG